MTIQLNAIDRDSTCGHSSTVLVYTMNELKKAIDNFEKNVPFARWYYNNEVLDGIGGDIEMIDCVEKMVDFVENM